LRHEPAWKIGRQRTAIDPSLALIGDCGPVGRFLLLAPGVERGERRLDIFQPQLHLVAVKLLGAPAELRTLKLLEQVTKLIVLGRRGIALAGEPDHQRTQSIEFVGCSVSRHASIEADSQQSVSSNARA
jgi:hypothetical protein